ncbi:MAG: anhydro-N-acetylmuramic acid kinase [Paracoccaceae bacterium]
MRVMGAMSGTSLDGVDVAVIDTDGARVTGFGPTAYRPYSDAEREVLRAALGRWEGPEVDAAAEVVELAHAEAMDGIEAELAGFHGQTLAHDPRGRGTLQVGRGKVLAQALGLPVVHDFRSADIRFGGEGAPLAPFYHFALAQGMAGPVAVLNLGGVGNLTWIDTDAPGPDAPGALLAFDTGPANAPMDDLMRARGLGAFDRDGALAGQGAPDDAVVEALLARAYFARVPPKSLDRDAFALDVSHLRDADAAATLAACCAVTVAEGLRHCPTPPRRLLVTGGGRRNPVLMAMIAACADIPVAPVEDVGWDGDMLEAQAFAHLAARVIRGLPTSAPGTTGVPAPVGGGEVARP